MTIRNSKNKPVVNKSERQEADPKNESVHVPVLLNEVINLLDPKPGEFFVDGTSGAGGHTEAILKKVSQSGRVLAIDWDQKNAERLKQEFAGFKNVKVVYGNYADLPEILRQEELPKANTFLLDLGFSSDQLSSSGRGFSFLKDEPLIMTYSKEGARHGFTAEGVINGFKEKELADIFYQYGEERFSRQIAKKIVEERRKGRIMTTGRLVEVIKMALPGRYEHGRIHPATRVFQALRIYVNDEFGNLETALNNLSQVLVPGGRAGIISFHSLEDRIVKNHFREMAKAGTVEILTKKPITATLEEIRGNPRSRSAKLRAIIMN